MYVSLAPSPASHTAIAALLRVPPEEFHCTLLHAEGAAPPELLDVVRQMWGEGMTAPLQLRIGVRSKSTVGPSSRRQFALMLEYPQELQALRAQWEKIYRDLGLKWSSQWEYKPHITLGVQLSSNVNIPAWVDFDCIAFVDGAAK